ncbi:hypothetical protein HBH47_242730 [Parastagonospora nodorum]|nr:hypothetical protein HBH47_242730 [Parastagonospora nodorum]
MIKFCWTKACLLCGAALKLKHSLYTLRCNSFLSLFCPPTRFATSLLLQQRQQSNDYTRSLTVFYSRREAIMAGPLLKQLEWYKSKANTISSNSMSQTNVREGYRITTLEVVELIEDLISYVKKKDLLEKIQSEKSQSQLLKSLPKYIQLRNAQIPKVFHEAAVRQYSAKVKTEDLSNMLTLTLSETAQRRSSSVVSNRSTALITDKFSVASLTKPAILNNANVALVDAVHHSVVKQFPMFRLMTKESQQKLEENYFEVMNALTITLIKDDDDLLGTVNSHIKLRRLGAVMLLCQTTKLPGDSNKVTFQPDEPLEQPSPPEQPLLPKKRADSRYAKASRGRTKKDKDSEDSDTGSDQLGKEAQLKKTRDEEELAKERETQLDSPLDSDDYCLDSSSDINPEDNSEDEEATTAKDLAREQKERLKALLNAKTRDGLSARVGTAIEHCTLEEWTSAAVFFGVSIDNLQNKRIIKLPLTDAYILYFKELLSNNGGIFANAIGIGKTRAMVLATEVQNTRAEGNAIEHNVVDDDDKLYPTKGERTFHCADPLALRFCFFSDSPLENIGRPTKEEAMEMRINTTNAISKALAAANKLVAPRSYTIPEANTPAVHPKATKHRLVLSAARFVIVCGFRKVDKHVFRAYNTMSGQTVFDEFHNCKLEGTIMAKFYQDIRSHNYGYQWKILIFVSLALISLQNRKGVSNWFNATDKRDSVTGDRIYKMEDARNIIANVKHDASEHESSYKYKELISQGAAVAQRFMLKRTLKTRDPCLCLDFLSTVQNAEQQCRDILEKEGLDKLEASRRVIFNRFKMQAIAFYPALATLKAAQFKTYGSCKVKRFTLNSVKDLFTNPSKDYFLVREARAITKSSLKFQNLSNLCSEVEILGTLSRIWSIAAEDAAKAANTPLPPKEVCAKILIGSYKPIVQAVTWLGLREKFGDESVLRDPDRPWIIVASMAFAEAITLTEATHVVIMEPQDSQLAEMCVGIVYFNPDSELELKVLDKLQGGGSTVTDQRIDWHQTELIVMSLEALC